MDALYPVAERGRRGAPDCRAICTRELPFLITRTSSGVLPRLLSTHTAGWKKPEKISAGGGGFMEKNDNLPP